MELKKRFKEKGFRLCEYSKKLGVKKQLLFCVLTGRLNGKRSEPDSKVGRTIVQLKKDGVWQEELPWMQGRE